MNYETATVNELHKALVSREITAVQILNEAKRVIKEKNPTVQAFLEVFDSANEDALRADTMIQSNKATPLTGIPIAVKDNIVVSNNKVSAGSKILEGFTSPYDATVVEKLKALGAVIVGRTNMDEFAMGSSTEHSAYTTTKNPLDTLRVPGGSSGGSAAAVAMGAVPLALGSDTGGSVRQPAAFCGVVGLKPTYGSVSRHGLIALGSSLDCIGQFARTVSDAMLLFNMIKGEEKENDSTVCIHENTHKNNQIAKVIGIPSNLSDITMEKEIREAFTKTIQSLGENGYTIKEIHLSTMEKAIPMYYVIQPAEASSNLARFDGVRYGRRAEGSGLWDEYIKSRTQGFGDEVTRRIVIGTYVLSSGYYDAYYKKAVGAREMMRAEYLNALQEVEVIMTPTTPNYAFKLNSIQDPLSMYAQDILTLQANLTGLPAISVPMQTNTLPYGVQILGSYNAEETLHTYAKQFERM